MVVYVNFTTKREVSQEEWQKENKHQSAKLIKPTVKKEVKDDKIHCVNK